MQSSNGKMNHRTPSGIGFAHRPSNATMDRSTAMHSGMPSPSTTMFKKASFNQSNSNHSTANLRFTGQGTAQRTMLHKQKPIKTSSYLKGYRASNKNAQFWEGLTKMAEKANKIETIDNRLNPLEPTGPATSIDTRPRV